MKRTVFHVVWDKGLGMWVCRLEGDSESFIDVAIRKNDLLLEMRKRCRRMEVFEIPCQMKVHLQNGDFEYENTYVNDPAGTKG